MLVTRGLPVVRVSAPANHPPAKPFYVTHRPPIADILPVRQLGAVKLISSVDTLSVLGKSAPKAWVKRLLLWMIFDNEIAPYFRSGRVQPRATLAAILNSEGIDFSGSMGERDEVIRSRWNANYWPRLVERRVLDLIDDDPIEWDDSEEPYAVGGGFFVYAEDIDWEAGKLVVELNNPKVGDLEHLFWDADEHLVSAFPDPEFRAELSGMCFPWKVIEMLQPTADMGEMHATVQVAGRPRTGRPRMWDWEGALTHLLALAQHPDGLPIGPGAQAQIERLIAEWFVGTTGNSPATSQIRNWAQKVMGALQSPKR